jgi:ribosomal protein S18 acetylase RimI-like enzyme
MSEDTVTMVASNDEKEVQYIYKHIREFNSNKLGLQSDRTDTIQLFLKNSKGQTIGGIIANQCWPTLEIHGLWVDESYRKQGNGKKLIQEAEKRARVKDCKQVMVNTMDFQAPGFYRELDYELCAECKGYVEGHSLYFFRKQL